MLLLMRRTKRRRIKYHTPDIRAWSNIGLNMTSGSIEQVDVHTMMKEVVVGYHMRRSATVRENSSREFRNTI